MHGVIQISQPVGGRVLDDLRATCGGTQVIQEHVERLGLLHAHFAQPDRSAHAIGADNEDAFPSAAVIKTASTDPNYCQRVTAEDGELGEQHLRDFQDNEKTIPTILTTSQKLSTGVDARNIRNIVLMRPIGSIIEFKQIIGRGTRLYDGKD